MAILNRAFYGASWADFVWESKLPSNYQSLVHKILGDAVDNSNTMMGKRETFTRLCQVNTFDDGTKVRAIFCSKI
ncbi:hypothetical protein J0J30_24260, partial [Vibrio vulnificus]|nr:hypothetical protein [Vibrio vulnificus]